MRAPQVSNLAKDKGRLLRAARASAVRTQDAHSALEVRLAVAESEAKDASHHLAKEVRPPARRSA